MFTIEETIAGLPDKITLKGIALTRQVFLNDKPLNPEISQRLRNHSPDGFNWGYGGSGPAQLSLSILLELLPEALAQRYYQDFKFKVVAALPIDSNFLVEVPIYETIQAIEKTK